MADFWTTDYWNDVPTQNYESDSHNPPPWDKDAFWVYAGNYSNGYERWDETYVWIPNIVRETPLTTAVCSGPSATVKYTLVERTEITRGTAETNTYQTEVHNEAAVRDLRENKLPDNLINEESCEGKIAISCMNL